MNGMFTSGISFPGRKHKKKMSKVQRIAPSLARFLYFTSEEKKSFMGYSPTSAL
jgi:hypothetical protein